MAEHYFSAAPVSAHEERYFSVQLGNRALHFETDAGTFSKGHLDPGSRLLIETLPPLTGRCADVGCGWGPIGIALAVKNPELRVEMVDVNARALELTRRNIEKNSVRNAVVYESDALSNIEGMLDSVVTNPPIRAGKAVIYSIFDQALLKLCPGGKLFIVIRKQQGAPSAVKHLQEGFSQVEILARDAGYWILQATK